MDTLLPALRAVAEPTRLRLLALVARGSFCVTEFTEIMGQSQPRLSRHLKLMGEAGLLERVREGANVWFSLPETELGHLAREILAHVPENDPMLQADRRGAARVLAERARVASESFQRGGAQWDEMQALGLSADQVEAAVLGMLPAQGLGRLLDIGTGTGLLLETLGPRIRAGLGVDASRAMLALARGRLARPELAHCSVRQADMYRLPLTDESFDTVVLQMVLHYAEEPHAALREAARVLRPGGRLLVVDLAAHDRLDLTTPLAHRWPGFSLAQMRMLLTSAGLEPGAPLSVQLITKPGALEVMLWPALAPMKAHSPAPALAD